MVDGPNPLNHNDIPEKTPYHLDSTLPGHLHIRWIVGHGFVKMAFKCPSCGGKTAVRSTQETTSPQGRYMVKRYRTCLSCDGRLDTAEIVIGAIRHGQRSKIAPSVDSYKSGGLSIPPVPGVVHCPACTNAHNHVTSTERRPDAYERRHKCRVCSTGFYSYTSYTGDGVQVQRRKRPRPT